MFRQTGNSAAPASRTGEVLTTGSGGGGGTQDVAIVSPIGQQPMADSVSVAIASDQSPVPVAIDQDTPGTTNRVQLGSVTLASSNGTPVTTATTTSVASAPSSGHHLEVYYLHASNQSATPVVVSWQANGGSQRFETSLPQYGVISKNLEGSWHLPTATALEMVTSAAGSVFWTVGTRTEAD